MFKVDVLAQSDYLSVYFGGKRVGQFHVNRAVILFFPSLLVLKFSPRSVLLYAFGAVLLFFESKQSFVKWDAGIQACYLKWKLTEPEALFCMTLAGSFLF